MTSVLTWDRRQSSPDFIEHMHMVHFFTKYVMHAWSFQTKVLHRLSVHWNLPLILPKSYGNLHPRNLKICLQDSWAPSLNEVKRHLIGLNLFFSRPQEFHGGLFLIIKSKRGTSFIIWKRAVKMDCSIFIYFWETPLWQGAGEITTPGRTPLKT